jgi:hypothetical protein
VAPLPPHHDFGREALPTVVAQDAFDGRDIGRGQAVRDALAVLWRG